ncbi:FG-GAP repeat protein [bacterium]|nr:FG-GAP repeat protein [bacterium]
MKIIILFWVVILLPCSLYADFTLMGELYGENIRDKYGTIMSDAGDINGDGYNDLLVGAPGSNYTKDFPGRVYVYLGGRKLKKEPDFVIDGTHAGENFGGALASLGDINGDGFGDFAVGAPKNDDVSMDAGKVYVFYGAKTFDTTPDVTLEGERANDWFGVSIDGGKDINGDGKPDFIVGASYGGDKYGGAAYIYLPGIDITKPALVLSGEGIGDCFGNPVALLGDVNNDGYVDFGVGACFNSTEEMKNFGRAYIYKGGNVIKKEPWLVVSGKREQEWLGYAMTGLGDVNGDEFDDFIIGAPHGGEKEEGQALLFIGGHVLRDTPAAVFSGRIAKDLMGHAVTYIGDLNKDDFNDIAISSPYNDTGELRSGRVDFYYGGTEVGLNSDMHIIGDKQGAQGGYSLRMVDSFFGKGENGFFMSVPGSGKVEEGVCRIFVYKIK